MNRFEALGITDPYSRVGTEHASKRKEEQTPRKDLRRVIVVGETYEGQPSPITVKPNRGESSLDEKAPGRKRRKLQVEQGEFPPCSQGLGNSLGSSSESAQKLGTQGNGGVNQG